MNRFPSIAAVFLLFIPVAASLGLGSITGAFHQSHTDNISQAFQRAADDSAFSTASVPEGFEVYTRDGEKIVVPQGIDTSKFSNTVFNAERQVNRSKVFSKHRLLVRTSKPEKIESIPGIEIASRSGDIAAVTFQRGSTSAFRKLSRSEAVEKASISPVMKALNYDANGVVAADTTRQAFDVNGSGVTAAVLDTGVNPDHVDYRDRIVDRKAFEGSLGDDNGHGTHVAGTVLGNGQADGGYYPGMGQEASLMSVSVLGSSGSGSFTAIRDGIVYAYENGADVISMSLGGQFASDSDYRDAVDYMNHTIANARGNGSIVIVAAGNEGSYESIGVPGGVEDALTVGAVDDDEYLAYFSSKGPQQVSDYVKPEVSAPGYFIESTNYSYPSSNYTTKSGTSMATPVVSGVATLVMEKNPGWSPEEVENAIIASGENSFSNGYNVFQTGAGVVNATKAADPDIKFSEAKFNYGNISAKAYVPLEFNVTSLADTEITYKVEGKAWRYSASSSSVAETGNASFNVNDTEFTLSPGETRELELQAYINRSYSEVYGGLVKVRGRENYSLIASASSGDVSSLDAVASKNATAPGLDEPVKFSGSGSTGSISSYNWDFNGTAVNGVNATYSWSEPGNKTVELAVENSEGLRDSDSLGVEVRDYESPEARLSVNNSEPEVGLETVLFNASESTDNIGINSYNYSFTGTEEVSNGETVEHVYSEPGDFTAKLEVVDSDGNVDSTTVEVNATDTTDPEASIATNVSGSVTIGEPVNFSVTASDNHEVEGIDWNNSDTGFSTVESFSTPGEKTLEANVSDPSNNSVLKTATVTVKDETAPEASIRVESEPPFRTTGNVTLNASGSSDNVAIEGYTWNVSGRTFSGEKIEFRPRSVGNNSINLTVNDTSGNMDEASEELEFCDPVMVNLENSSESVSVGLRDNGSLLASGSTDAEFCVPVNVTRERPVLEIHEKSSDVNLTGYGIDYSSEFVENEGANLSFSSEKTGFSPRTEELVRRGVSMEAWFDADFNASLLSDPSEFYNSSQAFMEVNRSGQRMERVSYSPDQREAVNRTFESGNFTFNIVEEPSIFFEPRETPVGERSRISMEENYSLKTRNADGELQNLTSDREKVPDTEAFSTGFDASSFDRLDGNWTAESDAWNLTEEDGKTVAASLENATDYAESLNYSVESPVVLAEASIKTNGSVVEFNGREISTGGEWESFRFEHPGNESGFQVVRQGNGTFISRFKAWRDVNYSLSGFRPAENSNITLYAYRDQEGVRVRDDENLTAVPSAPRVLGPGTYDSNETRYSDAPFLDSTPVNLSLAVKAPGLTSVNASLVNSSEEVNTSLKLPELENRVGENVLEGGCGLDNSVYRCSRLFLESDLEPGNYTFQANVSNRWDLNTTYERNVTVYGGQEFNPDVQRLEGDENLSAAPFNGSEAVSVSDPGEGLRFFNDSNVSDIEFEASTVEADVSTPGVENGVRAEYSGFSLNRSTIELGASDQVVENGDLRIGFRAMVPETGGNVSLNWSSRDSESLYGCSDMTPSGCESGWEQISTVSTASTTEGITDNSMTGYAYAETVEEDDGDDSDGDSGGSGGDGGGSSGGGGGFAVPDQEQEINVTEAWINISNFENASNLRHVHFKSIEASQGSDLSINVFEPDSEKLYSFALDVEASDPPVNVSVEPGEAWLDENNLSRTETRIIGFNGLQASLGEGEYFVGVDRTCYSTEDVSAVDESCRTYSDPCSVPEGASRVESCAVYREEQVRELIEEKRDRVEASEMKAELERAEQLLNSGNVSEAERVAADVEPVQRDSRSLMKYVFLVAAVLVGLVVVSAAFYGFKRYRKKKYVSKLRELSGILKQAERNGTDIGDAPDKLEEALEAAESGEFGKASRLTSEIRDELDG